MSKLFGHRSSIRSMWTQLVCLVLALVWCAHVQYSSAAPDSSSSPVVTKNDLEDVVEKIDSFIRSVRGCSMSAAVSVSVVKDGHVIFSKGYGYTSANETHPVTSSTKFGIGSLSKAFTAVLVAKALAKSENLTFDTPIKRFFPDFRLVDDYRSEYTSFRDLLGHRVALPRDAVPLVAGFDPQLSRRKLASKLQYLQTPFSFRERYIYNNYMYILAGDLLERMSEGREWEDIVTETIFQPLEMAHSGFVDRTNFHDNFALPCDASNGTIVDVDPNLFQIGKIAGPAGSISSTADDMAKWMMFLLANDTDKPNPDQLNSSMVESTFQPSMPFETGGDQDFYKPEYTVSHQQNDYCMGWVNSIYRGYRKFEHTGGIATHGSYLWLYPDANVGIFVVTNGPNSNQSELASALPYYISDLVLGQQTWFNSSEVCAPGGLPWNRHEREDENATMSHQNVTEFNCTIATQCRLMDYIGVYTHKVFGNASVLLSSAANFGSRDPNRLSLIFGSFGFLELSQVDKSHFTARVYGAISIYNSEDEDPFQIVFTFKNKTDKNDEIEGPYVVSLQMGVGGDATGPFIKQVVKNEPSSCFQMRSLIFSPIYTFLLTVIYLLQ